MSVTTAIQSGVRRAQRTIQRRLVAPASLVGAACLLAPLAAVAQSAPTAPMAPVHHHHTHKTAAQARETVNQRIAMLHTRLEITPDEEANWAAVAQVMRDNEARMQQLILERREQPAHSVTAVEDLKSYENFAQAHVGGLKSLISSFETLYAAMPAPQQAVADRVFKHFGHRAHAV
jgi:hypothetical protein